MRKSEGRGAGGGGGRGVLGSIVVEMVEVGVCAETVIGLVDFAVGASWTMLSMTGSLVTFVETAIWSTAFFFGLYILSASA